MSLVRLSRQRPRVRLQLEFLEDRNVPSGVTLTTLVPVSGASPLPAPPSSPTVFYNSEVEPQVAVDPANPAHAVAIWQQDRFRSVGGARALVVSVSYNANTTDPAGATWSPPTPIPYFNSTDPTFNTTDPVTGQGYARYTDPWVTITPAGVVYASALALTPVGPVPGHTAVLVSKSLDGGSHWGAPTMLIHDDAPPGTDPADLANDKEMIVADPTNPNNVYVVWDRLNHPGDQQNFNAFHGVPFREDMMFARTTDGGLTWNGGNYPQAVPGYPASDVTNFQANQSAFGNVILVQPDGTLVDLFTHGNGSGNQAPQADQSVVGAMRSTDHGASWSSITDGPGIESVDVTDPDTGAPVRAGEPLISVAVDPTSGNLYAVWPDGRFSGYAHDDIALSVSRDGGVTWSDPVKVNQTPTNLPDGDRQAFTPTVAVNSAGTVAVTYYDFRNNADLTPGSGLPTDYFIAVNPNPVSNPSSWSETQLTTSSFNMENAAPTSRGYFLGDYQGLAAAGQNFYALFGQAGSSPSDLSNIWFRDPPPAAESPAVSAAPGAVTPSSAPCAPGELAVDGLGAVGVGAFAGSTPGADGTGLAPAQGRSAVGDPLSPKADDLGPLTTPAAPSADSLRSGGGTTASAGEGVPLAGAVLADEGNISLPG